jgi:hypothetical protein
MEREEGREGWERRGRERGREGRRKGKAGEGSYRT